MSLQGFSAIDACLVAQVLPGAGILEYVALDAVNPGIYEPALSLGYNQQKNVGAPSWLKMPYQVGSGTWSEDPSENAQGTTYAIRVNFVLPGDSAAIRAELERMKSRKFLLRLTRNGQVLLVGTPETPLRFEAQFDSGTQSPDGRQHRCTFRGVTIKKSPAYVPVF